jgi:histidine kinase/DNA gyrase B/HSP90-like ATPase
VTVFPGVVDQSVRTGQVDIGAALGAATGGTEDSAYTVFREGVGEALRAEAREREQAAVAEARWLAALAVAATTLAVAVALLVARSIIRSLGDLTRQASALADHRLPDAVRGILETPLGQDVAVPAIEAIRVRASDEAADVATALTSVQETAVGLAVEQAMLRRNSADSFLNMGRRYQNLLARQLEFITELEARETDTDFLAKLFHLDHLATRMRRNAESLLVLAGVETPRRWASPVPITHVVRAAVGEVEDFARVSVRSLTPVTVNGAAASDLAHLLAELVENALTNSPAHEVVFIRGATTGHGYRLAVVDGGWGMTGLDLERANRRLRGEEPSTVAPSRALGHYVAGRLAARHGVIVRLEPTAGGGVAALIDLPPGLATPALVTPSGPPQRLTARVGRDGVRTGRR